MGHLKIKQHPYILISTYFIGLNVAARFKKMNIPTLIVEKDHRIGDNWLEHYLTLTLHSITATWPSIRADYKFSVCIWSDNMLYQPYHHNWPVFTPRDKLAHLLEQYAESAGLVRWTAVVDRGGRHLTAGLPCTHRNRRRNARHLALSHSPRHRALQKDDPGHYHGVLRWGREKPPRTVGSPRETQETGTPSPDEASNEELQTINLEETMTSNVEGFALEPSTQPTRPTNKAAPFGRLGVRQCASPPVARATSGIPRTTTERLGYRRMELDFT
ncbi:hypothetical protein MVEN_01388500 [Mycena venus]|uniref:FAD/NAD(P)-binding domain-containing protein n=1 Tax=Mycena venus TaxID=2733690 RepID=A0A8H6XYN7_9AGAR|nr:hypothetical protein MVEN_01388500 [Mycena venus]